MSLLGSNPATAPIAGIYDADIAFEGSSIFYGMQLGFAYQINDMLSASVGGRLVIAKNQYTGHIRDLSAGGALVPLPMLPINVDAAQSATGFNPIIGINITPNEKLNIGLKWEGKTALEFTNETVEDGTATVMPPGMYPNDAKTNRDMPMMISAGAQYKATDALRLQVGFHTFMDKGADWDGREDLVDNNFYEFTLGTEYDINEMFTVSAGYMMGQTGISEAYQSNTSFSLSSSTIGLGAAINLSEQMSIDLGFSKMIYEDMDDNTAAPAYTTNYDKDGFMFAIGVNYSIF